MSEQKKITPSPAMLADWADDTDRNLHSEVRIKIADWAARNRPDGCNCLVPFETLSEAFGKVMWLIDKGLCYSSIMGYRNELTDTLEKEIGDVYGEDVRQMVHNCL